jgi:hypothetical protein
MILRMIGGFIFAIVGTGFLIYAMIQWQYYTIAGMIISLIMPVVLYTLAGLAFYAAIQFRNKAKDIKESKNSENKSE